MNNFLLPPKTFAFFCLIGLAITAISCSDSPTNVDNGNKPTPDEFVKITTQTTNKYKYTVYALDTLQVGYNEIYIAVENSQGGIVSIQHPSVMPIMNMGDMMHSSPVSDVKTVKKRGRTYLKIEVFFIMKSMHGRSWMLKLTGQAQGGSSISAMIPVKVPEEGLMATNKVNGTTYYLTYVGPQVPLTGGDTYEVAVHYMKSMMKFPPVTGATVKLDAFMDMGSSGHGPASYDKIANEISPGRYQGNIVYSMAGEWQLTFTVVLDGGTKIPFSTFKIMVQM